MVDSTSFTGIQLSGTVAHLLSPRKKAVWGQSLVNPSMAKKGKEKKKNAAKKILSPSDFVLELDGKEEEDLHVEDEVRRNEKEVRPSSPSMSRTLGDWDTDTDACGASSGASKAITPVKIFDQGTASPLVVNGVLKKSWSEMVKEDKNAAKINRARAHGIKLGLKPINDDVIPLEDEDVHDISTTWGFGIIGYVGGRFPGVKSIVKEMEKWKVKVKLHLHPSGWLIFKLQSLEDRERVLDGGPYDIFGKPLLLKAMPNEFDYGDEEFTKVSIWIQLPNLPIAYWTQSALSKIGSKIGTPITSDLLTECKEHIAYARILVEVDVLEIHEKKRALPESVSLKTKSGKLLEQKIKYEYVPYYCTNCKMIGHDWDHCGYNSARFGPNSGMEKGKMKESNEKYDSEIVGNSPETTRQPPEAPPDNSEWTVVRRKKSQPAGTDAGNSDAGRKLTGEEERKSRDQLLGQRADKVGPLNPTNPDAADHLLPTKPDEYGPSTSSNPNYQQKEPTNKSNPADTAEKIPNTSLGLLTDTSEHVKANSSNCQSPTTESAELVGNQSPILTFSKSEDSPLGLEDIQMGREYLNKEEAPNAQPAQQTKIGNLNSTRAQKNKAQVQLNPPMETQAHQEEIEPAPEREGKNQTRGKKEDTDAKIRNRAATQSRPTRSKSKGRGSVPASNK